MKVRVLVVANEALVRCGLLSVLQPEPDIEVLGEATHSKDALTQAVTLRPDLLLIDCTAPGGDGITTSRAIKEQCPTTHVLMLVPRGEPDLLRMAAEAGVDGCVLKDASTENLVKAIRAVHRESTISGPLAVRHGPEHPFTMRPTPTAASVRRIRGLTKREVDVLTGVAAGLSDKEIAGKLFVSEGTVKTHLRTLYRRLGFHNRTQAVVFAVENGLLIHNVGN
jgi:DNA-binding NarL/FixJ family response regulator